ncbi:hypothetical protein [Cloacibacillus porcorum]|uniref:hypothetical protein n=1 Tax=Cloacibacillus porcorum TaxID=1197717 RepID=UPI0026722689|nr:hypothetical protein [Cloacibacillus porcorum]
MQNKKSILNEILREERARLACIEDFCSQASVRLLEISTKQSVAEEKSENSCFDSEWEKLYGEWSGWMKRKSECSLFVRKLESIIEFHDIRTTYSKGLYGDDCFYPPKLKEVAVNA